MNRAENCPGPADPAGDGRRAGKRRLFLVLTICCVSLAVAGLAAEPDNEPRSIRKMCGRCPDGYATTGVTNAPEVCKDGESTLVQCVPLGANLLAVCGQCPDGYREIGRSNVITRCGGRDGGLLTQCQQQQMDTSLPDPTQGGVVCPPNCGTTGPAGEGVGTPPPKFRPAPLGKEAR